MERTSANSIVTIEKFGEAKRVKVERIDEAMCPIARKWSRDPSAVNMAVILY